jgi:hypothetical protein
VAIIPPAFISARTLFTGIPVMFIQTGILTMGIGEIFSADAAEIFITCRDFSGEREFA